MLHFLATGTIEIMNMVKDYCKTQSIDTVLVWLGDGQLYLTSYPGIFAIKALVHFCNKDCRCIKNIYIFIQFKLKYQIDVKLDTDHRSLMKTSYRCPHNS